MFSSWWVRLLLIFLSGGLIMSIGTVMAATRGETTYGDAVVDVGKNVLIGLRSWDEMGSSAVNSFKAQTDRYAKAVAALTILVVVAIYYFTLRLLYKFVSVIKDAFRKQPMVSKTRETILLGTLTIILLGVLTAGFGFWRALVGL